MESMLFAYMKFMAVKSQVAALACLQCLAVICSLSKLLLQHSTGWNLSAAPYCQAVAVLACLYNLSCSCLFFKLLPPHGSGWNLLAVPYMCDGLWLRRAKLHSECACIVLQWFVLSSELLTASTCSGRGLYCLQLFAIALARICQQHNDHWQNPYNYMQMIPFYTICIQRAQRVQEVQVFNGNGDPFNTLIVVTYGIVHTQVLAWNILVHAVKPQ